MRNWGFVQLDNWSKVASDDDLKGSMKKLETYLYNKLKKMVAKLSYRNVTKYDGEGGAAGKNLWSWAVGTLYGTRWNDAYMDWRQLGSTR